MAGGLELVPFSKCQTSDGHVEGRWGGREGPISPHQQSLGRTKQQEKQGLWPGSWGGAQPCWAQSPSLSAWLTRRSPTAS